MDIRMVPNIKGLIKVKFPQRYKFHSDRAYRKACQVWRKQNRARIENMAKAHPGF